MEAKEVIDEYEYGELCEEILKNWNSQVNVTIFAHQNPFSMNHHQLKPSYDIQKDATLYSPQLSIQHTQPSFKPENEVSTKLMKHKEDKTMQATLKTINYEAEMGDEVIGMAPSYMVKETMDDFKIILNNVSTSNEIKVEKLCSDHPILKSATSDHSVSANMRSYACGSVAKLNFRLPSYKTICDINIDHIGEKLWRRPGVDISDFFNYGLDEKKWKDYCQLMRTHVQARNSGKSAMTADQRKQPHKEGDAGKIKLDRPIDECPKFTYSKDLSLYDSNVIIEIATIRETVYERAQPLSKSNANNTPHINFKMIKGEKILPFPMDSYSAEYLNFNVINLDRAIDEGLNYSDLNDLSLYDSHVIIEIAMHDPNCKKAISDIDSSPHCPQINFRVINGENILPLPMDSFSARNSNKRRAKRAEQEYCKRFQKRRKDYSLSQSKQKKVVINDSNHRTHHGLDVDLENSSCSSNSEINMEVGNLLEKHLRDPERLKRRRERYKLPSPNNSVPLLQDIANTDPDLKDQRPTRRRKWTNS